MGLISSLTTWALSRRFAEIQRMMRQPHAVQQRIFTQLLQAGAATQWGKQHGLHKIKNYDQWRTRVPISTYEDLAPYIKRMMAGEGNVLWPGRTDWFSKSSGTTNDRSKYIPVPQASLHGCHYKAGKDMIAMYLHSRPGTKVLNGKTLSIGGTLYKNEENPRLQNGDVSAVIMKNLPWWAQRMRAPGIDVALMQNFEEKIDIMARTCINENITSLSGVPTWTVVLLQRIMEQQGKNSVLDIWPNLEVFLHGAVAFGPYRDLFRQMIPGSQMSYMEIYNASEGFFGIQDDLTLQDQMLLMLDYGIFYEFLPMAELGKANPQAIPLAGVLPDVQYALVITTNGGLWRYLIGDTVKFTCTDPYRIKITGRTRHFINAFGEELIIENAEAGIARACRETGAIISEFTAAPIYMEGRNRGGHEWVLEFEQPPLDLTAFMQILDEEMRLLNSDYDAKRYKDMALQFPLAQVVPPGTFMQWMKRRGKLGGQHKVPRLSNNRQFVDDILGMVAAE